MATSNEGKEPYLAGGNKGWRSIFREDGRRGRVIRSSFVTHGSRMKTSRGRKREISLFAGLRGGSLEASITSRTASLAFPSWSV